MNKVTTLVDATIWRRWWDHLGISIAGVISGTGNRCAGRKDQTATPLDLLPAGRVSNTTHRHKREKGREHRMGENSCPHNTLLYSKDAVNENWKKEGEKYLPPCRKMCQGSLEAPHNDPLGFNQPTCPPFWSPSDPTWSVSCPLLWARSIGCEP